MKTLLLTLLAACSPLLAASNGDSPTGSRTTPPTLNSVTPLGVARGATVEIEVEGLNLAGASRVYFSEPNITGRVLRVKELPDLSDIRLGSNGTLSTVDLGPLPPRNQVTVEVTVPPDTPVGPVRFRLLTPLGSSPQGSFLVEPYYGESPDKEPNDTPEQAIETYLPAILSGAISKPGDVDFFKIHADAGQRLVFYNEATLIGSTLQPLVAILAEDQTVIKEFGAAGGMDAVQFSWQFDKAGTYYVRVSDYDETGRASNFYRILIGQFPLVAWTDPLGVPAGKSRPVSLYGYNLASNKIDVAGKPTPGWEDSVLLRPKGESGVSFNEVRLAVGGEPEAASTGSNLTPASAQPVTLPITINGHIAAQPAPVSSASPAVARGASSSEAAPAAPPGAAPGSTPPPSSTPAAAPVANYFRFHARKDEQVVIDVQARRLGSPLDSFVEVLDAQGRPIERAEARAVLATTTTLSERDSASSGIRLLSWTGMNVGDYIMIGNEIIRLAVMPKGPDEDTRFDSIDGQRLSFFDTSTEAHAIDKPVYKIQIYPPGRKFSPNGLPLVPLYFQNDDGGPGYGKDSLVHFTAPADGDYLVRIHDVQGLGGDQYVYRLSLHNPRPDFRLAVNPANPNIPRGGSIPITVEARRLDGFDGPIDVRAVNLPAGLHATSGVIAAGEVSSTLLLSADPGAHLDSAAPLEISGSAHAGAAALHHRANAADPLTLVSLMPKPDVVVTAAVHEIDLVPGGRAHIPVSALRQNGFRGRIPLEVLSLPPRVLVPDVGLNGVLLNEDESNRTITLEALPNAEPGQWLIVVVGRVETRSPLASDYAAPTPILLRVKPASPSAPTPAPAAALSPAPQSSPTPASTTARAARPPLPGALAPTPAPNAAQLPQAALSPAPQPSPSPAPASAAARAGCPPLPGALASTAAPGDEPAPRPDAPATTPTAALTGPEATPAAR